MSHLVLACARRNAWRLARPMVPDLAAKATTERERSALDRFLKLSGPALRVDWVGLAFSSRCGGRFKLPGAFGALYGALTQPVALAEAAFNWTRTWSNSSEPRAPGSRIMLTMLRLKLTGALVDVRRGNPALHDPASHAASQAFGLKVQMEGRDGLATRSVCARSHGTCVIVFRPEVVVACVEAGRNFLVRDGTGFRTETSEKKSC